MAKSVRGSNVRTAKVMYIFMCVILCALLAVAAIAALIFVPEKIGTVKADTAAAEVTPWSGNLIAAGWNGDKTAADKPSGYEVVPVVYDTDGTTVITKGSVSIFTADAFAWFSHEVAVSADGFKNYVVTLKKDIDLNNKIWIPIGYNYRGAKTLAYDPDPANSEKYTFFQGEFDGDGHVVRNFSTQMLFADLYAKDSNNVRIKYDGIADGIIFPLNSSKEYCYGLFGCVDSAIIKNLTLENVNFSFKSGDNVFVKNLDGTDSTVKIAPDSIGGIVANATGSVTLENLTAGKKGGTDKFAFDLKKSGTVGGIIGRAYENGSGAADNIYDATVKQCTNNIDISYNAAYGNQAKVGGIGGYLTFFKDMLVEDCVNNGDIGCHNKYADTAGGEFMGGIIAYYEQHGVYSFVIKNCINNGDVTSKDGNKKNESAGGIIGQAHEAIDIYNCINYGTVYCDNRAGGILGKGGHYIQDCANFGNVGYYDSESSRTESAGAIAGDVADSLNVHALSGLNAGTIKGNSSRLFNVSAGFYDTGKSNGSATTTRNLIYFINCNGGRIERTTPESAPTSVTLTYSDAEHKIVSGVKVEGDGTYSVTIPATVEKIAPIAFLGKIGLTEVIFEGNKVKEIGDAAFAGTGLSHIELPDSVEKIGKAAFAQLAAGFNNINVPSSVTSIDDRAFCNNVKAAATGDRLIINFNNAEVGFGDRIADSDSLMIAKDKAAYTKLAMQPAISEYVVNLTYPMTITYKFGNETKTEKALCGQPYGYYYDNITGVWKYSDSRDFGQYIGAGDERYRYYTGEDGGVISNKAELEEYIVSSAGDSVTVYVARVGEENTDLYFAGKSGIVFGSVYRVNHINTLLSTVSDRLDPDTMIWNIKQFVANGSTVPDATAPTVFYKAGTYTVEVMAKSGQINGGDSVTFDIVIEPQSVELANVEQNLVWQIVNINGARLQDNTTIYIYTKTDNSQYISTRLLSAGDMGALGINSSVDPVKKTVVNSVARYRGTEISVGLAGAMVGVAYEAKYSGDYEDIVAMGTYTVTATLTPFANYALDYHADLLVDAAARGLTITAGDGADAGKWFVTKTWYIADLGNTLNDYIIGTNNKVEYDSGYNFIAPETMLGGTRTFTLALDGYGNITDGSNIATFDASRFNQYVNASMPAGKYTLTVSVSETEEPVYDTDGETVLYTIHHDGFSESIEFEVMPKTIDANVIKSITEALTGTFEFTWAENVDHLYSVQAQTALNAAFALVERTQANRTTIANNVWAAAKYNNFYMLDNNARYLIMYNRVADSDNSYVANMGFNAAGKYVVNYMITAPNYVALELDSNDKPFSFTTLIVRELTLSDPLDKTYNGEVRYADIPNNPFYIVSGNTGWTDVGTYKITVSLIDKEIYRWGDVGDSEPRELTFNVTKAVNYWREEADIVRWVEGKYNADENLFIGSAQFGDVVFIVTSTDGNTVYFDEANGINELAKLEAGEYHIIGYVVGTNNYTGLNDGDNPTFRILKVLEKPGLPWWAVLLIAVGSVGLVVGVFFILWKKGVFRIITDKILVAIRTRISVDSTIAAVRAQKRQEEIAASRAAAIAKEQAQENREKAKQAAAEYRALPAEQKAKQAQDKAAAALARAEKARQRAELMQAKANRMSERAAAETVATTPPATEQPAAPVDEPTTPPDTNPTDSE